MKPRLTLIAAAIINSQMSYGSTIHHATIPSDHLYSSRITGQFLGGNQQISGFGDGMMPLLQNNNALFFADGAVMLGQDQRYTVSGGLGYRGIFSLGMREVFWVLIY